MLQPAKEGLSRQDSRPRRGELDRQRQAVKPSTDLDNGGRVVGAQLKERVDGGGSFNKQAHRVCPLQPLERCRVGGTWKSKWREVKCHFASAPKKATAGSDDPKLWAALEQVLDDGDGIRQLFQIVKEEKRLACGEVIDERVEDRPGAHLADPDRPSDRRRQDRRVRYRCEAYEGRLSRLPWCASRLASSRARRVFPLPPGPVSVTRWFAATVAASLSSSCSRPTNVVSEIGRNGGVRAPSRETGSVVPGFTSGPSRLP